MRYADNSPARLAASLCVLTMLLAGCGKKPDGATAARADAPSKQLAVPEKGAYTGAYIDFGDREDAVTLEAIEGFEQAVGKHQAIVAFSSFWGEGKFPQEAVDIVVRHDSVPLIFWSPWDWPYREEDVEIHGPDKYNLNEILAGKWDAYIDRWAEAAKAVKSPMLVSLCNEANGSWFPWSAVFYGGKEPVPGSNPPRYKGPETVKRAYRYIVDRVRARGAANVQWVLHLNNYSDPYEPWNALSQFYPGDQYVDWVGLSVYGQMYPDDPKWADFDEMLDSPYEELGKIAPSKPLMVTEWGVGEFPERGDKGKWIAEAFDDMETDFPRVRAAIYWHERWQNNKTMLYSNLKVDSSPGALDAYRRGVADPYWLGTPAFK